MESRAKEKIDVYIEGYEELKRNREFIKSIDKDYFFELIDCLIEGYREYEEENKRIKMSRPVNFKPSINDNKSWFSLYRR